VDKWRPPVGRGGWPTVATEIPPNARDILLSGQPVPYGVTVDLQFTLPNVGAGADPCSFDDLANEHDALCLLLQRDYYCTNCRKQVQAVADRYDEFQDRRSEVVSVVPEAPETLQGWQDAYDLPYPLLADPEVAIGGATDQPVRFGLLGRLSDFFGRMPQALVIDVREEPEIAWSYSGRSTFDRPSIDEILAEIDRLRDGSADDARA
jgi:peroxiredoxin Q/BCP